MKRLASLLLPLAFLIVFAPAQLGGRATYAIVHGNSMEPNFRQGDLVLVLAQAQYLQDDIVLYDHPEIGPVFHRIIGVEEGRFVFKGDNNSWIDTFQARAADVRGKYWLMIPGLGDSLTWLRSPGGFSIASLTIGALMVSTTVSSRNDPKRSRRKRAGSPNKIRAILNNSAISVRDAFFLSLALTPLFMLLAFFAFVNPTYVPIPTNYPYQHFGEFTYTSSAPTDVYDGGQLKPGDPIFRRIDERFDIQFAYALLADGLSEAKGSYSLSATVGESNGWKKVVELIPPTPFEGSSVSFSAPIRIDEFQALVDNLELATGVELGQYRLTVQPKILIEGVIRGIQWQDEYAPSLPFVVNDIQVRLENQDVAEDQPLSQSETGAVFGSNLEVAQINLFGINMNIHGVRILLALLVPTLLGIVMVTGWQWFFVLKADRVSQIAGAYGPKLVDVSGRKGRPASADIEVSTIEDLARIADREGATILHEVEDGVHYYFVDAQNGTYVFRLEGPSVDLI